MSKSNKSAEDALAGSRSDLAPGRYRRTSTSLYADNSSGNNSSSSSTEASSVNNCNSSLAQISPNSISRINLTQETSDPPSQQQQRGTPEEMSRENSSGDGSGNGSGNGSGGSSNSSERRKRGRDIADSTKSKELGVLMKPRNTTSVFHFASPDPSFHMTTRSGRTGLSQAQIARQALINLRNFEAIEGTLLQPMMFPARSGRGTGVRMSASQAMRNLRNIEVAPETALTTSSSISISESVTPNSSSQLDRKASEATDSFQGGLSEGAMGVGDTQKKKSGDKKRRVHLEK